MPHFEVGRTNFCYQGVWKSFDVAFDQVAILIIIHFLSVLMDKCEGHLLIKSSENIVTRRSLSCVFFLLIDGILFICPYSIDPFRTKIKSNKTDKGNYFFYVIYSQTTVTKNLCKNLWKYFFVIFYNLLQHNYPKYCTIKTLCKIKAYVVFNDK